LEKSKKAPPENLSRVVNEASSNTAPKAIAEDRKGIIIKEGSAEERIATFIKYLKIENLKRQGNLSVPLGGNIGNADKVCSVGLGLAAQQDLPIIEALAEAMGAQMGCSRPFAEENKWLPLDRYVGISGQKFKGALYLAIGISGQVQHLGGIRDAKLIAAINSDEKAPIFAHVDYGIVGDLYEIVPLLIKSLK